MILNAMYERFGPKTAAFVTRFFAKSSVSTAFVWKAKLGPGALKVPVLPELHRSWTDALLWRWPPNLPMRRLYGEYLDHRCAGVPHESPGRRGLLLDVGANDGMHTCLFALAGWDCVAFEPQTSCIEYLACISKANHFDTIVAEQCVVGDQEATAVEFYVSDSTWFSSLDRASVERFEPAATLCVDMITLDAYCETRNLTPACIKIDVEGRELSVVRGAQRLLKATRPDLVIEVSADPQIRRALWDLLAPLGYHAFVLTTDLRSSLRAVSDVETFVAAGTPAAHVDSVFTTDDELSARLKAHRGSATDEPKARRSGLGARRK